MVASHPPGSAVKVFYDPNNPGDSVLEPGINGGMMQRHGPIDGQAVIAYVCTATVTDLDAVFTKALDSGGAVALEKMAVPGVGWLAYIKDTEGNILGLMQPDPKAA